MNLQIASDSAGTDYALHGLNLRGFSHEPNKPAEFFVLRDEDKYAKTQVRLFLHRDQLLQLKREVDAMVAQLTEPGIMIEEEATA